MINKTDTFVQVYNMYYLMTWVMLNTTLFIEIITENTMIDRHIWIIIFIVCTIGLLATLFLLIANNYRITKINGRILLIHITYVLSQLFIFLPIVIGAGVSYTTIDNQRFEEYLCIFFITSLPCVSIFLFYVIDHNNMDLL
jgi:hypothetical protein